MKILVMFILGILIGAYGLRYYEQHEGTAGAAPAAGQSAWNLSGDEVRSELARTGKVVRSKAQAVGRDISDVRIVAVIKAKYLLDRDLSATAIRVRSRDGDVELDGTAPSPELVARAVALALATDGVHNVTAKLTVPPGS